MVCLLGLHCLARDTLDFELQSSGNLASGQGNWN